MIANLRPYRASDRDPLVKLLEDSYRSTWAPHVSAEAWERWSQEQRPLNYVDAMGEEFVVADLSGEVAAMVHWRADFIHALHVRSQFHRRGIGSLLLAHAEQEIAMAGHGFARLETDSFNAASRAFYAANGYSESGSRPADEWGGEFTTLLLVKALAV